MKWLRILFLAAGLWLFYAVIRSVGIDQVSDAVRRLNWTIVPLLLIYLGVYFFNALGWAYSFPKSLPGHVPFSDLFLIRLVGETLNSLIPWAASLGGEPVKAQMLKDRHDVPLSDGLASLLIVHTTLYASLNVFVIGGVALAWNSRPLTPPLWNAVIGFLVILGSGAALLIAGLYFGVFANTHSFGQRFGWWKKYGEELGGRFRHLDEDIRRFYTADRWRFWVSTGYNFIALLAGVVETYFLAQLLGLNVNWAEAWLLEALIQALRIVTFFIPGSVGAQEGGIVYIFTQLGFAGPQGLAFALVRRVREIVWMGVGLLVWPIIEGFQKKDLPAGRQAS